MSTSPLVSLAAQITPQGITAPTYDDILGSLIASFKGIYGSDAYLEPDGQDYQLLAVFARALHDSNQTAIAVYNSFNPSFSQGVGLSSLVKINGIQRQGATVGSVVLTVVGVAGTQIENGVAKDIHGNLWDLPPLVIIPDTGTIDVTATARNAGNTVATTGEVTGIYTPQLGWQTVTNASPAIPGVAQETDAALRRRQSFSTSLPAQTPLESIHSSISNLRGVTRAFVYENDTESTDAHGIPAHSISVVVEGGDVTEIAQVIESKKTLGAGTYGTTTIIVNDPMGLPVPIHFFVLVEEQVYVSLTIDAQPDYVASTGDKIKQAIVDFINSLDVGDAVYINHLIGVAGLVADPIGRTFNITAFALDDTPAPTATADLIIPFNKAAACLLENIVLSVV